MNAKPINNIQPATKPTPVQPSQPGYWVSREEYERLRDQPKNNYENGALRTSGIIARGEVADSQKLDKKAFSTYLITAIALIVFLGLTFNLAPQFGVLVIMGIATFLARAVRSLMQSARRRTVPLNEQGKNSALKKVFKMLAMGILLPIGSFFAFLALFAVLVAIPGSGVEGS